MTSQIFLGMDLNRTKFDLSFTETINRCMQVPNKLKILLEPASVTDGNAVDDHPPSYQMHIPERISLAGVEMMEVSLMPFHWEQVKQKPPVTPASQCYSTYVPPSREIPLFRGQSGSSTMRSLRRVQEMNNCSEKISADTRGHDGQEMLSRPRPVLPFPSREEDGRMYSLSNVCRTLRCLGILLFCRLRNSFHFPARSSSPSLEENEVFSLETSGKSLPLLLPSPQENDPNRSSRPVDDLGLLEIVAMRNQLIKISRRLQNLEEERAGGYQKELLIFSALLTACLLNTLLWLRK
ncbi:mitochondrial fission factor-like isoform X2 [Lissotriton helveticus]